MPKSFLSRLLFAGAASTLSLAGLVGCSSGADASLPTVEGKFGEKPKVEKASAKKPDKKLKVKELIPGKGEACGEHAVVNVAYHGLVWNSDVFESSWDRGETSVFPLDQVIPGWKESLSKAKKGSRMLVSIPPEKAYGAEAKDKIPANSTLVFVVDVFDCYGPDAGKQQLKAAKPTGKTIPGVEVTGQLAAAPKIKVDSSQVNTKDLQLVEAFAGDGEEIRENDMVLTHVTKVDSNGKNARSSWNEKIVVPLDPKSLKGLTGKKVGSRIYGVLPPEAQGQPAAVVVIDLVAKAKPQKLGQK